MRKRTKVIQIAGFRGLLLALFAAVCLVAGFIGFPGMVAMNVWNHFQVLPAINLMQGILLWTIIAMSVYLINNRKVLISFGLAPNELNDEEMKKLMDRVKLQSQAKMLNSMLMKSNDLKQDFENDVVNDIKDKTSKNVEETPEEVKK